MATRRTGARTAADGVGGRVHGAWLAPALAALVSSAGCGDGDGTAVDGDAADTGDGDAAGGNGVCLLVRTDMAMPDEMNQVEVAVTASGTSMPLFDDSMMFLGRTAADFPFSVCAGPDVPESAWRVAVPAGYEWILFRASAVLGTHVVTERWQVGRLDGAFHETAVDLQATCIGVPCAAGEECVGGTCRPAPRPDGWTSFCGDAVPDAPEECDDGEMNSDLRANACRTDCRLPRCGDGVIDTGEQCDDGNTTDGDGCRSNCQLEAGG